MTTAFFVHVRLLLNDCLSGASLSAGAAGDAGIRVDDIDAVALGDRLGGALAGAGAAGNASVRDFVSHIQTSIFLPGGTAAELKSKSIITHLQKIATFIF
jgi:hypothetical protein